MYVTIIKSCRGSAFISKKVRKGYMSRDEAARVPAGLRNRSNRRSNQFKAEPIEYLDCYNNRRVKAKLRGLPPSVHRNQALEAA